MIICMFAAVLVNLGGQFDLLWSQLSDKPLGLPISNFWIGLSVERPTLNVSYIFVAAR